MVSFADLGGRFRGGETQQQDKTAAADPINLSEARFGSDAERIADRIQWAAHAMEWAAVHQQLDHIEQSGLTRDLKPALMQLYDKVSLLDVRGRIVEMLEKACPADPDVVTFLGRAVQDALITSHSLKMLRALRDHGNAEVLAAVEGEAVGLGPRRAAALEAGGAIRSRLKGAPAESN